MTNPIITPAQMTTTDEHLLALAKIICTAMTGPSDFGWADQSDQYRAKCMDAALRAIVAERQAMHLETCPSCSGSGMALDDGGDPGLCHECKGDTVVVRETPVCERQPDLLSESERQAIRDQALEDAAKYHGNFLMTQTSLPVEKIVCSEEAIRAMKGAKA